MAPAPGKDAKPEEIAAWRKERGLPDKAADYVGNLKLADGVTPGEADKPLLDAVAALAYEKNYPQEAVNDFVGLYYALQDSMLSQRERLDAEYQHEAAQRLMAEMGADFGGNMNALKVLWSAFPPEVVDAVLTARTADGRVLGNIPEAVSLFTRIARELNPAAAILPPGGGSDAKAVGSRKAEIEKMMYLAGKPNPAYWGNEGLQKEYRDLIDVEARMSSRAA